MTVSMDLYRDFIATTLAEIRRLEMIGFKFESFEQWSATRTAALNVQITRSKENGLDTAGIEALLTPGRMKDDFDQHLVYRYIELRHRIPDARPPRILRSTNFVCPAGRRAGLVMLEQEITRGQSLFPRLSRQIYNSATQDGLLLDWGVFHFHLGTGPGSRYPQLIQGHSEILYAAVDDDTVYFLTIDHHGKWADEDILRIIKNDFPYLLDPFRLDGVLGLSQSVSETERTALRRAGASTLVELDGHVYAPPGGGINSAGGGMASTMQLQQTARWYSAAEDVIRQHLSTLADEDPEANWIQDADFEFRLKSGEDHEIAVRDDNLAVSIVLNISADNQRFDSIRVKKD